MIHRFLGALAAVTVLGMASPLAPWDQAWGGGFVKGDDLTRTVFEELSRKK